MREPGNWSPEDGSATSYGGLMGGHYWSHGMPVGGIGTGAIEMFADGRFGDASIFNNFDSTIPMPSMVMALSVKTHSGAGKAALLCLDSSRVELQSPALAELPALSGIEARAAWPFMRLENLDLEKLRPLQVAINAWSPMVIGSEKDSSYPAMVVELDLTNPADFPVAVGAQFFVPDMIGHGGSGAQDDTFDGLPALRHDAVSTGGLYGVLMSPRDGMPTIGRAATFAGTMFVGVETSGVLANRILHRDLNEPSLPWWDVFVKTQRNYAPNKMPPQDGESWQSPPPVFEQQIKQRAGCVVGASMHLLPHERRVVPFIVAWNAPAIHPKTAGNPILQTMSGARWSDAFQVAVDLSLSRHSLKQRTSAWHKLLMESNYPKSLKVRMVNDLSALVTNSLLLGDGRFLMLTSVGSGRGLAGMMTFRLESYGFLSAAFPRLDASELSQFVTGTDANGNVPPMLGDLHEGLTMPKEVPVVTGRVDLPAQMVISLMNMARSHYDEQLAVSAAPLIDKMIKRMQSCGDFSVYSVDTKTSGVTSYCTGIRIAALRAAAWINDLLPPDKIFSDKYSSRSLTANADALNEYYVRELLRAKDGCPRLDSTGDNSFTSALAGDWALRGPLCGLRPILDDTQLARAVAALVSAHITNVASSDSKSWICPVADKDGKPVYDVIYLSPLMAQLIAESFYGSPSAELVMKPLGLFIKQAWGAADPWRQPLRLKSQLLEPVSLNGSPATMASWRMAEAISGFNYDPFAETIYLDPKLPDEMGGVLSVPVITPLLFGLLKYDAAKEYAALKILSLHTPPGKTLRVSRVASGVDRNGKMLNERPLYYPVRLEAGKTIVLRRKPVALELN